MKALTFYEYGTPDVLKVEEMEKPSPKPDEVLIKVKAASINSWDWDLLHGRPWVNRMMFGLSRPKKINILGCDIAGTVEEVGSAVSQFKVGDNVFGDLCNGNWSTFAEYACANEKNIALMSPGMSFEDAAALPQAGVMAVQSLIEKRHVKTGDHVLLNGAGGGIGTLVIQIARTYGAEITGVDSEEKLEAIRSLGADHVIDYRKHDFTANKNAYDIIIDVVANRSLSKYKNALKPNGVFQMIGGTASSIIETMAFGSLLSMTGSKKICVLVHKPNQELPYLKELYESGKLKPVIDRTFPLEKGVEAFKHFGAGHFKGKVVITM